MAARRTFGELEGVDEGACRASPAILLAPLMSLMHRELVPKNQAIEVHFRNFAERSHGIRNPTHLGWVEGEGEE